jgi:hypothetical protein
MRRLTTIAGVALVAALASPAGATAASTTRADVVQAARTGEYRGVKLPAALQTPAAKRRLVARLAQSGCNPYYLHADVAKLFFSVLMQDTYKYITTSYGGYMPGGPNYGVFYPGPTAYRTGGQDTHVDLSGATLVNANVSGPPIMYGYGWADGNDCSALVRVYYRFEPPYPPTSVNGVDRRF